MSFNTYPPNGWPPSTGDMEAGDITAEEKALIQQVPGKAGKTDIAPEFSAEAAYSAGDIVYYNGGLYEFTADHAAGAWSTDDTQAVTVGGEIATLSGDAADLNINKANQITIAPFFNAEESYDPGDLVYYNGLSFRCVNAHEGAWDFDDFAATTISNELSSLESGLINITHTGNIPSNSSASIAGWSDGNVRMIVIKRASLEVAAVVLTEYWSDALVVVYGSLPESITITKSTTSNDIVIANGAGSAIAYLVIN